MACWQGARRGEAAVVLQRHSPLEQRHAVGQEETAGGYSAHDVVVDDLPGGGVGGVLEVVDGFVSSGVSVHGKEQCEGGKNQKKVRGASDKGFHDYRLSLQMAKQVIEASTLQIYIEMATVHFTLDYDKFQSFEYALKKVNGHIIEQDFAGQIHLTVTLPLEKKSDLESTFSIA